MLAKASRLAIDGGKPAVEGPLARFDTIGDKEALFASHAMTKPLSGYLGGERHGGYWVERLEGEWAEVFGVKHAVACNSATSGLLLACMACDVDSSKRVLTTPYTMSATAAAPAFLGGDITFGDIEEDIFCLKMMPPSKGIHDITITTNLFGHPSLADKFLSPIVIEDNAQAIFAKEGNRYAGTIGHIGVFSGNIHKAIQCGEGGMCVTDDAELANRMRLARNHGELAGGPVGLNLRLTEVQAAIWCAQLSKSKEITSERIEIAESFIKAADIPGIRVPITRTGCTHVYYCVPLLVDESVLGMTRKKFVEAMKAEGVPLREGYVIPLYKLPAFKKFVSSCPVTERVETSIMIYENCQWTPTPKQLKQFADAFTRVAGSV